MGEIPAGTEKIMVVNDTHYKLQSSGLITLTHCLVKIFQPHAKTNGIYVSQFLQPFDFRQTDGSQSFFGGKGRWQRRVSGHSDDEDGA